MEYIIYTDIELDNYLVHQSIMQQVPNTLPA